MYPWESFIDSARFEFERYKAMGDKTLYQLSEEDIQWTLNESDNSIALIVKHLVGNMHSRWTNFLTEDGEKEWRNRENEFTQPHKNKAELIAYWNTGWDCLFTALHQINSSNFDTIIKIRNEEHTIIEAVNRQLAHYASHVGQLVLIGKMRKGTKWVSLSIPKGDTKRFNHRKFKPSSSQ
ncbi:MAG: hypothetical protein ACI9SG_002493 [Maribacter sp.]|jgi:hypothetical protein